MLNKKIDEIDNLGNKISKIISRGEKYLIYEINSSDVAYYSEDQKITNEFREIEPIIEKIRLLTDDDKSLIKIAIRSNARALLLCALNKSKDARILLEEARKRMAHLKILKGRFFYLLGAIITIILDLILTIMILSFSSNTDVALVSVSALFGALGGLLSVIVYLSKISIDSSASRYLNIILGSSRIFISMICGLFTVILVKSNILLGVIENIENNYGYFAIAIVGGFSETYIPNLLRKIASKSNTEN